MGVTPLSSEQEALALANDTSICLASYCFTKDINRIQQIMEQIEAGIIGINNGNYFAAESPFEVLKQSGCIVKNLVRKWQ